MYFLGKMDPDGDESAALYKKLVEEKEKSWQEENDKIELASEEKEKRKISTALLQVNYILHIFVAIFSVVMFI